jgi:hypothetical protein
VKKALEDMILKMECTATEPAKVDHTIARPPRDCREARKMVTTYEAN